MRFHDLRHSVATLLLGIGTHPKVVQELLGHGSIVYNNGHLITRYANDAKERHGPVR